MKSIIQVGPIDRHRLIVFIYLLLLLLFDEWHRLT